MGIADEVNPLLNSVTIAVSLNIRNDDSEHFAEIGARCA